MSSCNYNFEDRIEGRDWPTYADTMIGLKRLENIEYCVNKIIEDKVPGDLIETGVWRGGATIFMVALLKEHNIDNKVVWVADSFLGLPKPNSEKYVHDKQYKHYLIKELAVSLDTVKRNFVEYGVDEKIERIDWSGVFWRETH